MKIVSDILKENVEDRILIDFKDEKLFNESYKNLWFLLKFINISDDNKNNFDNNEQDLIKSIRKFKIK